MTTPVIRLATSADSDAILGIYAPYIDTSITFEEEAPTREAFQVRTDGVLAAHPYLVAELDGKVVGYAYAHELRERGAYRWNSELSVYLAPAAQGHGLGAVLYRALIELCAAQGIKAVYGIVTSPNDPTPARRPRVRGDGSSAPRRFQKRAMARRHLVREVPDRPVRGRPRFPGALPAAVRPTAADDEGYPGSSEYVPAIRRGLDRSRRRTRRFTTIRPCRKTVLKKGTIR